MWKPAQESSPSTTPLLHHSTTLPLLRFEIEDTGVGIAPEKLQEIFVPFHQVGKRQQAIEGTGLGLTISYKLVRLMGGELQIRSIPGAGSTFWFEIRFPVAEVERPQEGHDLQKIIGYSGKRRTVLVADDNEHNRTMLLQMLFPLGFHVIEAQHGQECVEKVLSHKPDIILLDLRMPVMDGYEAAREIRALIACTPELASHCPLIIAVSASVFKKTRQKARESGFDDFLFKPFQQEQLLHLFHVHLHLNWRYESPPPPQAAETVLLSSQDSVSALSEQPLPSRKNLEILLDLASKSRIKPLLEHLAAIEEQEPHSRQFVQDMRQFARAYQTSESIERVSMWLKHVMSITAFETQHEKILIVDDSEQDLKVLNTILSDQGYTVYAAINPQLALKAVQNFVPDLIILDIMMPGMDGYELCHSLKSRESLQDVPILFTSILNETADKIKAFEIGGVDYVCKPFQFEEILARVKTHLTLRRMQQQLHTQNAQLQQEIAERKRTEEQLQASLKEKNVLLKEVHHRVKNNLQIISSLLKFQQEQVQDRHIVGMFDDCQSRIRTMALVHEQLYQTENLAFVNSPTYLRSLTSSLFRAYKRPTVNISLLTEIDEINLGIDTAIACGLIINELVSNALKYAFPVEKDDGTKQEIYLALQEDRPDHRILRVRDNGVGFPSTVDLNQPQTLGIQLVKMLIRQLKGTLELERQDGTSFTIRFPIAEQE